MVVSPLVHENRPLPEPHGGPAANITMDGTSHTGPGTPSMETGTQITEIGEEDLEQSAATITALDLSRVPPGRPAAILLSVMG